MNNIKIDNSVVGSINTGKVNSIDVSITQLKNAGGTRVGEALTQLTEAIANDATIDQDHKRDLLDQVQFVSDEAVKAAPERRPGMIKAAIQALEDGAKVTAATAAIWATTRPLLGQIFGFDLGN